MLSQGFLLLNKPVGVRSTACVEAVRRSFGRGVKTGHGGTLDSTASGLLVLLINGATRLSSLVMQMPKVYMATVKLGYETSTCDRSGEAVSGDGTFKADESIIDSSLMAFLGWRMQTPPEVSAVHVGGRRAHEVFRSGETPDLKPRPVFIETIQRSSPLSADGEFDVTIRCGKGTYVRSIARDLGRRLGCGAHLAALRRDSIGHFSLGRAISFEGVLNRRELEDAILPADSIGEFLPAYDADRAMESRLMNGLDVSLGRARRRTYGLGAPKGTVMFSSASLISIGHIETRDNSALVLPDINIKNKEAAQ